MQVKRFFGLDCGGDCVDVDFGYEENVNEVRVDYVCFLYQCKCWWDDQDGGDWDYLIKY